MHERPVGDAWTPAVWFLPTLELAGVGRNGLVASAIAADHLQLSRQVTSRTQGMAAEIAGLSRADLYLDGASALPARLDFETHPTGTVRLALPVEIRYSGWHVQSGIEIPRHIERWVANVRQLAIDISDAEINPPLPAGEFELGGGQ